MVRPLVAAAAATLLLSACGDDDDGSASAAPPPSPGLSGTVLGQPFTPVDGSALVLGEETCSFEGVEEFEAGASATGILLGFGSFQGLCELVTSTQGCGTKANSTIVTAAVVRSNFLGRTASAVAPGTYTVAATIPSPDLQGNVTLAQAVIARNGAAPACEETSGTPTATSGTIRIDAISETRITGSVDLTFEDGSRISGTFDVARCGYQTDVCTALGGGDCVTQACVP